MKTSALTTALLAVAATGAYAENLVPDSVVWNALIQNAPEACTPDEVPALRYVTPDRNLAFYVSGQLKATIGGDFDHVIDDPNNFTSLDIPIHNDPGCGGAFMFSAQQSAVSFNLVALPGTSNQVGLYVTTNLLGENYTPAIEYALVNYRGLSVGYGYTLFADTRAALPTIDYMGPCGYTGAGNAGVQYRVGLGRGFAFGAAVELPLASYTPGSYAAEVHQRVPAVPVALTYGWNGGDSWVRCSAVLRNMIYRDMVAECNRNNVGWGVQLSGSQAVGGPFRLFWQATYGRGITSYFQDYTDRGYDMMPDPARPGRLNNVKAWGGYAGVQCNFTENVYICAGYSQVRDYADRYTLAPDSDDADVTPWGKQSKYTQYAVGNLFWDINSYLSCGIEYIWGRRVNFDGNHAHDSRLQAMLQFAF